VNKRTAFLIMLLVLTAIPTVPFSVALLLITRVILSNSGNIEIFQHGDILVIKGQRGWLYAVEVPLFVFIGLFISCIIFFVSLFLLIRGWLIERRKKSLNGTSSPAAADGMP
jgi:hypothetical protein